MRRKRSLPTSLARLTKRELCEMILRYRHENSRLVAKNASLFNYAQKMTPRTPGEALRSLETAVKELSSKVFALYMRPTCQAKTYRATYPSEANGWTEHSVEVSDIALSAENMGRLKDQT